MEEKTNEVNPIARPWYKKKRFLIPLGIFALVVAVTPTSEDESSSNGVSSSQTNSSQAEEEVTEGSAEEENSSTYASSEYGNYPQAQREFLRIIEEAKDKIDSAETELQESVALRQRDKDLCALLDGRVATNWTGKITKVGANGEGKAHVEIELADDVRVKTWNNAFSDISDNTLIPTTSKFFDDLVAMSEDTTVKWSGKFLSGDDFCLKKANLTNVFYARDPQFIVRFSDIQSTKDKQ